MVGYTIFITVVSASIAPCPYSSMEFLPCQYVQSVHLTVNVHWYNFVAILQTGNNRKSSPILLPRVISRIFKYRFIGVGP